MSQRSNAPVSAAPAPVEPAPAPVSATETFGAGSGQAAPAPQAGMSPDMNTDAYGEDIPF